jgi:hypothetical protein
MKFSSTPIAALLFSCALSIHAQQTTSSVGYKVQLDLQPDTVAKNQPTQHFTLFVQQSRAGILKAIDSVPVETNAATTTIDVGVSIECTVQESEGKLKLQGNLDVSRITGNVNLGAIAQPIIVQRKLVFDTALQLGAPTQVAKLLAATVTKAN